MDFKTTLENLFVEAKDVPAEFSLPSEVHQREYLSNGVMKQWDGPVHEVFSPICIKTENGLERKLIGSYPVCTEAEAQESLEAAVVATITEEVNGRP